MLGCSASGMPQLTVMKWWLEEKLPVERPKCGFVVSTKRLAAFKAGKGTSWAIVKTVSGDKQTHARHFSGATKHELSAYKEAVLQPKKSRDRSLGAQTEFEAIQRAWNIETVPIATLCKMQEAIQAGCGCPVGPFK